MARYQFRFSIPDAQQGNHQVYTAYVATLKRLGELKGTAQGNARVEEVQATSGSVAGSIMIEAPSCEEAMRFVCQETPILDLEWHVEEYVDPIQMAEILDTALRRK
jgi:hypothetical protein